MDIEELSIEKDVQKVFITRKEAVYAEDGKALGIIGFSILQKVIRQPANQKLKNLTLRESEIVLYLMKYYTAKDIADMMSRSVRTIEKHIENIKMKLHVNSKKDLFQRIKIMNPEISF